MDWLVTGGAGYVGAHVAHALAGAGFGVVVLDDLSTGRREFVPDGIPLVEARIGDREAVAAAVAAHRPEGIIHLAALKYAGESVLRPLDFWRNNVAEFAGLLEQALASGIETIVFSSSSSVYGTATTELVDEESPTAPESPYGETKLAGEWMLRGVARAHGLRHTSLRYFNVAGSASPELPDTSPHNLFPLVCAALREGRSPHVNGIDYPTPDGSCVRDYVHPLDIADAHVAAAAALADGAALKPVYNLGSGEGFSVLEIIQTFVEHTGISVAPEIRPRRPGDPARALASWETARADLGWQPRRDLLEMVSSTWEANAPR